MSSDPPPRRSGSQQLQVPGAGKRTPHHGSVAGRKPNNQSQLGQTDLTTIANEEWQSLLKGEKYPCKLLVGSTNETRDVILNVNLSGIRLLDAKNEAVMNQFEIEQILQYSYSQQNSTFSFSYLEEGKYFVTHKFLSPDFLEIHQYLGNAIAIVIKLKTQLKKNGPNEFLQLIDQELTQSKNRQNVSTQQEEKPAPSAAADRLTAMFVPPITTTPAEKEKDKDSIVSPAEDTETISEGTISKSSRTKELLEEQYKKVRQMTSSERREMMLNANANKLSFRDKKLHRYDEDRTKLETPVSPSQESGKDTATPTTPEEPSPSDLPDAKGLKGTFRLGTSNKRTVSLPGFGTFGRNSSKKKTVSGEIVADQLKRYAEFEEYDPSSLPSTVTKTDPNGKALLIKTMMNGKYQITAGTIESLVEALADQNLPDSLYIDDFLLSFRNFMTPDELLQSLRQRFEAKSMKVIPEQETSSLKKGEVKKSEYVELDEATLFLVKLRICSLIKKWVERHYYDFMDLEMAKKLQEMVNLIKQISQLSTICKQIETTIADREKYYQELFSSMDSQKTLRPPIVDMDEISAKDIAQQLTLASIDLYQKIVPDEFVVHLWGKKNDYRKKMTLNLTTFIDRFNKLGFWVATEICKIQDIKKRSEEIEKHIKVAQYCMKYQNFNDCIAILSGLNTIPIYRLKKTWALVGSKSMSIFRELEQKTSPEGNYKAYRHMEFEAKPPLIPFFGLYMKDLTFMNDGNSTMLPGDMVNLEKHRTIMAKIMAIRVSQQSQYQFSKHPAYTYFQILEAKEEEELTDISYQLEPSNRRRRPSVTSLESEVSVNTTTTARSL